MIGVDSNVLLRLLVDDDPAQHGKAVAFFADRTAESPAYINLLVLAELVWLLDRRYGYSADRIATALERLLATADIVVEDHTLVTEAVAATGSKVGLVDLLISAANRRAGASHTVTFDHNAARRISGMSLLA